VRASCVHASTESYTQTCVNDSGGSPMQEASFNLFLGFPSVIAASIGTGGSENPIFYLFAKSPIP
jgi:hypothetical protein